MSYINNENVLSIKSIGDWNVSECPMSGTIEWSNSNYSSIVYATPNWVDNGVVPIDISTDDGEYDSISNISLEGSISQQLNQYEVTLKSIFENL